jgi:hypothetical protein
MSELTPDQTDEIKQILRTSAFARDYEGRRFVRAVRDALTKINPPNSAH